MKYKIFFLHKALLLLPVLLFFPGAFEYRASFPSDLFPCSSAVVDYQMPGHPVSGAACPWISSAFIASSACRPYSMKELYSAGCSGAVPLKPFGFSGEWNSFGMEGYSENAFTCSAGAGTDYLSFGAGIRYYSLRIRGGQLRENCSFYDCSAGILFRPSEWITAGISADNLSSFFREQEYINPFWSTGVRIALFQGLSLIYNLGCEGKKSYNSISLRADLLPSCSVSAGYGRETMTWAGSVTVLAGNFAVSYGLRRHPYLGATHVIGISLLSGTPAFKPVHYGSSRQVPENYVKIDINNCPDDDIRRLPCLEPVPAERLIAYRKKIGPLTERALIQLGLTQAEADLLRQFSYGLAEEQPVQKKTGVRSYRKGKKGGKSKRETGRQSGQNMFLDLVEEAGLPPTLAMDLIEAARKSGREGFMTKMEAMEDLSQEQKRAAEDICRRYW